MKTADIKKLIRGEVSDLPETIKKYSRDASIFEIMPSMVAYPEDPEDIVKLVNFANESKEKLSLTIRAEGTDMSGGAINDSIIIDTKHLNKIVKIENDSATVQPGVMYKDFDIETLKQDLFMPIYPASRDLCSI